MSSRVSSRNSFVAHSAHWAGNGDCVTACRLSDPLADPKLGCEGLSLRCGADHLHSEPCNLPSNSASSETVGFNAELWTVELRRGA